MLVRKWCLGSLATICHPLKLKRNWNKDWFFNIIFCILLSLLICTCLISQDFAVKNEKIFFLYKFIYLLCSIRGVKRTLDRIYMRRHTELGGVGRQTFKFNQAVFFFCLGIFQIEGGGWPMQCPKKGVFLGFFSLTAKKVKIQWDLLTKLDQQPCVSSSRL